MEFLTNSAKAMEQYVCEWIPVLFVSHEETHAVHELLDSHPVVGFD